MMNDIADPLNAVADVLSPFEGNGVNHQVIG